MKKLPATFKQALNFLKVDELREICSQLSLPVKGKKGLVINRIVHFLQTGNIINEPIIPPVSCAQPGKQYPLKPSTLIVKGSYKNDLATRMFFKKLIGQHFHFTAFGQDWTTERWLAGKPPTYQEFADMWRHEYEKRKKLGSTPKDEWAYINFVQKYIAKNPQATRKEITGSWKEEQARQRKFVEEVLIAKK
ncbi:MAG: hypothetical protein H6679_03410 [Epsilonproteobacteria bacterium]|nr:hypothetical protein [Campylobacterota bacterium]